MGKKVAKPKKSIKPHTFFEIKGDVVTRKRNSCPKCGKGIFLAKHKDREVCGKCGYMEKTSKKVQVLRDFLVSKARQLQY